MKYLVYSNEAREITLTGKASRLPFSLSFPVVNRFVELSAEQEKIFGEDVASGLLIVPRPPEEELKPVQRKKVS